MSWNRLTTEEFIRRSTQVHGDKYDYSKVTYTDNRTPVMIYCLKEHHGEFTQRPEHHMNGIGCPACSDNKRINIEDFVRRAMEVHGDKYDYSKTVVSGNNKSKIQIGCRVCASSFLQIVGHHLNGNGCSKCAGTRKLSQEEYITRAVLIHGEQYDYSRTRYVNATTKVTIICRVHGEFLQNPMNHTKNKQGCPSCNTSLGEERIRMWLTEARIPFRPEYKFPACVNPKTGRKLPFDFYIPEHNTLIEFDGAQHFGKIFHSWWTCDPKEIQERDSLKNKFALEKGIHLIRIPYTEYARVDTILGNALQVKETL